MELRLQEGVSIPVGEIILKGEMTIPAQTNSIILFAHASGNSRFKKRNRLVAKYLHQQNFGTLVFDLLTEEEDEQYYTRFDIELLTKRLAGATEWLEEYPATKECRIGYFAASTGAASALKVAAHLPCIKAIVSRGGRPDLAKTDLTKVNAPTLLIVGSLDYDVLQLNKSALRKLNCEKQLELVDGASHMFDEEGKMELVSELASNWFERYLTTVNA